MILKASAENQRDVETIYDRLLKAEIGDVVTYANLNDLIGGDVQNGDRHKLESARRRAKRRDKYDFDVVRNHGLRRLNDSEIITTNVVARRRIHRTAVRAQKRLQPIDIKALSDTDRNRALTEMSITAVIVSVTDTRRMKTVEKRVEVKNGKLDLGETLKLFAKGKATPDPTA